MRCAYSIRSWACRSLRNRMPKAATSAKSGTRCGLQLHLSNESAYPCCCIRFLTHSYWREFACLPNHKALACPLLSHLFGWMINAIMSRTFFLTVVVSGIDELCELWWRSSYGNFRECWCAHHFAAAASDLQCARRWDHLILDMILCNGLGAWIGFKVTTSVASEF